MKTRYFVSDDFKCTDLRGKELKIQGKWYFFNEDNGKSFAEIGSPNDKKYITKVEEMELSDFIADGRTKYELNGIRFVVLNVDEYDKTIKVLTDEPCCITKLHGYSNVFHVVDTTSVCEWFLESKYRDSEKYYHSHIEDIKLVTTCVQCGKDEIQDAGLCSDCISKLPKIESRKVVDIHKSENGSFSVGSVVNM